MAFELRPPPADEEALEWPPSYTFHQEERQVVGAQRPAVFDEAGNSVDKTAFRVNPGEQNWRAGVIFSSSPPAKARRVDPEQFCVPSLVRRPSPSSPP